VLLAAWWALSHAIVGLAWSLLGGPWPLKCLGLVATAAHAVARRPPPAPRVILRDGFAELPDSGLVGLTVEPRSRYTWWWVHLRLRAADGRDEIGVVLLADQLHEDSWRALQAELRRTRHRSQDAPPLPSGKGDSRSDLR
jgi:hypothetical protein